jgi:uncharacterized membrane protein
MKSKNIIITHNKTRLEGLADGLFAIVMTLLVLELSVPVITGGSVSSELISKLIELWPKVLIYILSFVLLGTVWENHHIMFHYVARSDGKLAWMNIILLMFVALVPFSASLLGNYIGVKVAAVVYGINFLIILIMHWLMWTYMTRESNLTDEAKEIETKYVLRGRKGYLFGCFAYAIGIGIAFINPIASIYVYGLLTLIRIITMIEPKLLLSMRIVSNRGKIRS